MTRGSSGGGGALIVGGGTTFGLLALACIAMAGLGSAIAQSGPPAIEGPLADIPADYLAAYRRASVRFELGADGWSYLAGVGKVESDHGRSTAAGVTSGQNSYGCCAGPMQIDNGFATGGGTWGAFKVDGDGDHRLDIYDRDDAVATAGRYLHASGAPRDWRRALFAYNHASWYVHAVSAQAAAYRHAAGSAASAAPLTVAEGTGWLATVPGFPGERCDRRIVPEVVAPTSAYGLQLIDCYGRVRPVGP
jgi:hypothetical protein